MDFLNQIYFVKKAYWLVWANWFRKFIFQHPVMAELIERGLVSISQSKNWDIHQLASAQNGYKGCCSLSGRPIMCVYYVDSLLISMDNM